jgi:hypothetical protein
MIRLVASILGLSRAICTGLNVGHCRVSHPPAANSEPDLPLAVGGRCPHLPQSLFNLQPRQGGVEHQQTDGELAARGVLKNLPNVFAGSPPEADDVAISLVLNP